MKNDGTYQNAENEPDAKNKDSKSEKRGAAKAKTRKRRLILYEWLFWILGTLAGISFFVNHTWAIFSIGGLFVGLIFGALALRLSLLNHGSKLNFANAWCAGIIALSIVFCGGLFSYEVIPERKATPDFVLALRIGGSAPVTLPLTNDFLLSSHFTNTGELPNGSFLFKGYTSGCLVVPVTPGESNKVFTFIFENNSHKEISDLEGWIGLPIGWRGELAPKWKESKIIMNFPALFRLRITNLQYWSAVCSWTLYPFDRAEFPAITNRCTITRRGNVFKEGVFVLGARAAGLQSALWANVLFVPVPSNAFVPFLAKQVVGKDGKATLSLTKKQLERYGKVTISEGQ